jgi:hypothetical protein
MARAVSETDAVRVLAEVLQDLALVERVVREPRGPEPAARPDLTVHFTDGRVAHLDVKASAHPANAELRMLVREWQERVDRHLVLVVDALPRKSEDFLARSGVSWLERGGRLVLAVPGALVDTQVQPVPRHRRSTTRSAAIRGESGASVAFALLLRPEDPPGVRDVARISGLTAGAISQGRQWLQAHSLVDGRGRPLVPELFWELARVWRQIDFVELVEPPGSLAALDSRYGAGLRVPLLESLDVAETAYRPGRVETLDHPHDGWAEVGTVAALAYGADLIPSRETARQVLVPPARWYRVAAHTGSPTTSGRAATRLGLAPTTLATRIRRPGDPLPLAHPLAVALTLAGDSRGREILETFRPEGCAIVWR